MLVNHLPVTVCAPRKWQFFKGPMNFVDLLAIMPFYLSLFLAQLEDVLIIGKAGKIIRLIRWAGGYPKMELGLT